MQHAQQLGMTVKRPPYALKSKNHTYTADLLRELLEDAEAAKLDGIAIAGITQDNVPVLRIAGRLKHRPREAYWLVSVLQDQVLKLSL